MPRGSKGSDRGLAGCGLGCAPGVRMRHSPEALDHSSLRKASNSSSG
jgi:hypothetical protein